MDSEKKMDYLNQPLGYEIARLLLDTSLRRCEIKENLPYGRDSKMIHANKIQRVLDDDYGIFEKVPTKGQTEYTLNNELFSQGELEDIKKKADARQADNTENDSTEESEDDLPDQGHADLNNMPSMFYDRHDENHEIDQSFSMKG